MQRKTRRPLAIVTLLICSFSLGCGDDKHHAEKDSSTVVVGDAALGADGAPDDGEDTPDADAPDAKLDAATPSDASLDASAPHDASVVVDASMDSTIDSGLDAGSDAALDATPSSDSSVGSDTSVGSDASADAGTDASADSAVPDAGPRSDASVGAAFCPGVPAGCTLASQVCCLAQGCVDKAIGCADGGASISCDGPEDCSGSTPHCCASGSGLVCAASCGGATICQDDPDCPDAEVCFGGQVKLCVPAPTRGNCTPACSNGQTCFFGSCVNVPDGGFMLPRFDGGFGG